jgi:integrase
MRQPKPFFRKQTGTWYVQLGKQQHSLGSDKDQAFRKYHALMSDRQPVTDGTTVLTILKRFLAWNKANRSDGTHSLYHRYIISFSDYVETRPGLPGFAVADLAVGQLKPFHVNQWIDATYGKLSANARRNSIRAVQRAFNWAVDEGHLAASPIKGIKKPAAKSRDAIIEPEQWKQISTALAGRGRKEFLDWLTILRQTGCRPQEARTVEARHIDRRNHCLVFEREESKGHGGERTVERRVVPLTDEAFAICIRLAARNPDGSIFRNEFGGKWTRRAIGKRFERLSRQMKIKHGWKESVSAYLVRHTWATEALERGVDPVTVATIMGHKDLTQLMKTYQHLKRKGEHLRRSMEMAIGAA